MQINQYKNMIFFLNQLVFSYFPNPLKMNRNSWKSLVLKGLYKLMFISIQGSSSEGYDPTIAIKSCWNSSRKLEDYKGSWSSMKG